MRRHRATGSALLGGLLVASLALAACGSSDDAGRAEAEVVTTAAAPTATDGSAEASPGDETAAAPSSTGPANDDQASDGPATSAAPGATSPVDDVVVPPILDFTSPTVGGGELDLATLAGRPVLLWFWAPF